jgi:YHS domain-containing protein
MNTAGLPAGNIPCQLIDFDKGKEVNEMAVDPVCKMNVDEKKAAATYEYKGKKFYFCAVGCKEAFAKNPEKYVKN